MRQKILYDTRILEMAKDHESPLKFFVPSEHAEPNDGPADCDQDEIKFILTAVGVLRDHIAPSTPDFVVPGNPADLRIATLVVKNGKGVPLFEAPLEVVERSGELFTIEPQGLADFSVEIVFAGVYRSCVTTKIRVYLSCLIPN